MKLEKLVLVLAGLIGIASFFMPYFRLENFLVDFSISGYTFVEAGLDAGGVLESASGRDFLDSLIELFNSTASVQDYLGLAAILFVLIAPVIFLFFSLFYVIRGLFGKQYRRGIFFTLVHLGLSWLIFFLLGRELETDLNFFSIAQFGYWVGFGAMILAAISLFFEKSKKK